MSKLAKTLAVCIMMPLLLSLGLSAQDITVKGTVTDENGEPVAGAAVLIKGTNTGVQADLDGAYSISVPSDAILSFSAISFQTLDVQVRGRTILNVTLQEDAERLSEATVTAEFGMKRISRAVGSSVQNVKASDIADSGRESFVNALQGRIAGMTVTATSGVPGASTSVILRSATSISGNNQPLFVIDGVPINNKTLSGGTDFAYADAVSMYQMDFSSRGNDINPEDIESMTVLKGAAAAALYGSDASNGAIIITTKKGSAGRGKVSYSNSLRWDKAYGWPEIQKKYANGAYGATNYYFTSRSGGEYPSDIPLYDNVSALLQTGFSQTHNLSVEGGTDKVTVRGAVSYTGTKGVVKTTDYDRFNVTLSGRADVTNWLNFEAKMEYVKTGNTKASKGLYGTLWRAMRWPVTDDMSNWLADDGQMRLPDIYVDTDLLNPLFALNKNVNHDEVDRLMGSFMVNITPSRQTFLRATYGSDFSVGEYKVYTHPYWGDRSSSSYGLGTLNYSKPTYKDNSLDIIAGYNNEWDKFTFSAHAGYHQKENGEYVFSIYGDTFSVIDFYSISNCLPSSIISRTKTTRRRIQAISARAEFGYNNMAFITLSARNDWSSTLPKDNNHYFYPSIEAAFIATELPFLKDNDAVSYLKLKGAATKVGKDATPLSIYPSLETTDDWGGGFRYGYTGPNTSLKPEMNTSQEVGFEGRFLNDRINADFTYFWTRCSNQYITGFRMSYATGFVLNNMNVGTFTTNGWEAHIDGDILRLSNGLRWNLGLNIDHSTSEVTSLPDNVTEYYNAYTWVVGNTRNGLSVGNPITTITGLAYQRNDRGDILINPATGIPYTDSDWSILGDRQPKFSLGITSSMSYKQFRLSALLSGKMGASVLNGTKYDMMSTGSSWESVSLRESPEIVFKGVLKDGKENTDNPTVNTIAVNMGHYGSNVWGGAYEPWFEKNVHYLRLSEVRLSYRVPQRWLLTATRGFVSAANVWVKGSDLYTWTNYSGFDPVGNSNSAALGGTGGIGIDYYSIPNPRGYALGVNLTF